MKTCPFCKKKLNKHNSRHIYSCKFNNTQDRTYIKYMCISHNHKIISNKNVLYDEYVVKTRSLPDIRKEYDISYNNILFLLDYHGIKKRTMSKSSILISTKKYKNTCEKKYGVDNVSKVKSIKNKNSTNDRIVTLVNDMVSNRNYFYWIKNIPRFDNKNAIKSELDKQKRRYIRYWDGLNDEQKHWIMNNDIRIESKISDCLDILSVNYVKNFKIGRKIYDIKISRLPIIIEVNSNLWHANPTMFEPNSRIDYPIGFRYAKKIWDADNKMIKSAENNGYKVIQIWEDEIHKANTDNIINIVISKIQEINSF